LGVALDLLPPAPIPSRAAAGPGFMRMITPALIVSRPVTVFEREIVSAAWGAAMSGLAAMAVRPNGAATTAMDALPLAL